ncbi:nucleotide exchange factor GrpE [Candidatus Kuenenbacteria bacterium CG11_big_fil_rev_8_21_14_0_20_37_9]|uniref:Protein GrpE n=2 Tax=Candidatus Kueneniibacteriota TaxID=1752740 RepID=A0A2M6XSS9_9BACT|nr:MAG: nucleotide exchange factor GrpE [Candidatus Kuenenbacteria bacterium CG1_02_38_13]PIR05658.1 MAG: nucleotide exchange factor GrpE [Candidatus Kuenenbacteria bacterium CG11_big_fil_rev_8_21_14_0_20_37_9]PIU10629.1 MAG: nucleotide exchange factor GrpE [Candidatus Kuenenbacteria bacterium CG08_land_8_20_14_0_20_37_23]
MFKKKEETRSVTIEELKAKSDEYLAGWQRAKADYHNLEKEVGTQRQMWVKMANADLLIDILPIYNNLKLAVKHIPESQKKESWVVGVEHIKNQLKSFLDKNGIEEIEAKEGDSFDPELHDAIDAALTQAQPDTAIEPNKTNKQIIKQEIQAGYKLHGKVLHPARVIVG